MTAIAPPANRTASPRWRTTLLLSFAGVLANLLAVTAPGALPLALGNAAVVAIGLRFGMPWALPATLPVAAALGRWEDALLTLLLALLAAEAHGRRLGERPTVALLLGVPLLPATLIALDRQLSAETLAVAWLGLLCTVLAGLQLQRGAVQRAAAPADLASQLSASLGVGFAMPLILLLLLASQALWHDQLQRHRQQRAAVAAVVADEVESHLDRHRRVLRYLAADIRLPDRLPDLRALRAAFPGFLTLLVSDRDGNIVHFHAPGVAEFHGNVADRSYFTAPRDGAVDHVSDLFQGRGFGNDLLVAISAAHRDGNGQFNGVVEGSLSLQRLRRRLATEVGTHALEFVLIDRQRAVVMSSLPDLPALSPADQPLLQDARSTTLADRNRAGKHLLQRIALPALQWEVVVLEPLAALNQAMTRHNVVLGVFCLAILLLLGWRARRLVLPLLAPLDDLVQRFRRVDLQHPASLQPLAATATSREFDELVADFNAMLARLQSLHGELSDALQRVDRLNAELEVTVEQRTAELRTALQRAEALSRAKSVFLANMSHELRTPLTAILGFAEQALEQADASEGEPQTLQTIVRHGQHLLGIVDDVLDASRIEAGELQVESRRSALLPLLEEVQALLAERARSRGLSLDLDLHWPLPAQLDTDPLRLRQILINLVGNAIKFTQRGGVRIEVAADPDQGLAIAVQDSGIGLSIEQQQRLFAAFQQADVSTTRRFGGSGLGLFICAHLSRALGGSITVDSTPGAGARFTLQLPLTNAVEWLQQRPAERRNLATRPRQAVPALRGRVLVVDDVADLRLLVQQLVSACGAETSVASDGEQALARCREQAFDLVLMDMHMPTLDGRDATRALRARGYRGPIVALTADVLADDVAAFRAAGCDEVLAKPLRREQLYELLRRVLPAAEPASTAPAESSAQRVGDALMAVRERFRLQLHDEIVALRAEAAAADPAPLRRRLHSLKGSAGTFGFGAISRAAAAAERALVENHDWTPQLDALLAALAAAELD